MSGEQLGQGTTVSGGEVEGVLRSANEVPEVFELLKRDDLGETILVTDTPSATAIVPLLPQVAGVVCRSGGLSSHLAIVAREFGLPCLVAAELPARDELEGVRGRITADGRVERA